MGNPYPTHTCTVSPFDSYNSNVVNRLTRIVSNFQNCIYSGDRVDVTLISDSTSETEIEISSGSFFKDDVFINISGLIVDMADGDYYLGGVGGYWNEEGYYYITVNYIYEKARPAPRPSIRILKPSQRDLFSNNNYLFLKAIRVQLIDGIFAIISSHDSDPENPTIKRTYSRTYFGFEDVMPDFDVVRDYGRFIFVRATGDIYYGTIDNWAPFGGGEGGGSNPLDLMQLAMDMYSTPQLTHSGAGILSLNLESQLVNLRQYVGASDVNDVDPLYSSITTLIDQGIDLTTASSRLDAETNYIRNFIGKSNAGNSLPQYSSTYVILNSDDLATTCSKLDDISQKIKNFIGKPDNTGAMAVYTSSSTIVQNSSLLQAISVLDQEASYLRTFDGKSGPGNLTPSYSSIRSIVNGNSLVVALSTLDLSIGQTDLIKVISDNSVTPSILSNGGKICGVIRLENSAPTSITDFIDCPAGNNSGISITLIFGNSNTTIVHNVSYISLDGAKDLVGSSGTILVLTNYGGVWYEATRSAVEGRISILTGTVAHGGTIPLPAGFSQTQCKWMVSINNMTLPGTIWGWVPGGAIMYCSASPTTRIVTCYSDAGVPGTANYIIIGIR